MIILNPTKPLKNITINPDCEDERYNIITFSPSNINGNKYLKNIKSKIKNNKKLSIEDYEVLESLVYSQPPNKKHKALLEASKIINSINCGEERKNRLNLIFQQQCLRYVKKEFLNETLKVLLMAGKGLMEEYKDNLIKEGKEDTINKVTENLKKMGATEKTIKQALQGI